MYFAAASLSCGFLRKAGLIVIAMFISVLMINNVANLHDTHVGVRAYVLICEDTCLIMQLCA